MNNILNFLKRERLYILILIFVMLFSIILFLYPEKSARHKKAKAASAQSVREEKNKRFNEEFFSRRADIEESLRKNEKLTMLFGLTTLLIFAILLLGIFMDFFISSAMLRKKFNIRTLSPPPAKWTIWDICKVVILFLFFGYIIVISEAFWSRILPILKSDNFRMIINTSILDILTIFFIIYFTVIQYKEDAAALGLSLKNFFKNIFYGVAGYIALIPVLILILAATLMVIKITKYVPPRQPVVELFLKEKNITFLTYSSFFAAIFGPIIEELFFRGFMYNVFKKYVGIFWSMVLTAAIFAALHTHIVGFLPIMALGMFLAYLYEKTGTLVSSTTVHIIHNLSMVFLVFLVRQVGIV
jgi:membrane protease YdiL (CAAX protease family)